MIEIRFRPMPIWPYPTTPDYARRSPWAFKAEWHKTLALLRREVSEIGVPGAVVLIGIGLREHEIRQDGQPRANAGQPQHPGVEISFDALIGQHQTRRQRLVYHTDTCVRWRHNVRSIALGLEALRAVDRYGISYSGEQYAGFKALPPGGPSIERGLQIVERHGSLRRALHATHPDHGGDPAEFADVQAAREAGVAA